jgi:predicted transcriptional regulator
MNKYRITKVLDIDNKFPMGMGSVVYESPIEFKNAKELLDMISQKTLAVSVTDVNETIKCFTFFGAVILIEKL